MAHSAVATAANAVSQLAPFPALSLSKKQIGKGYFDAWVLVRELQLLPQDEPLDEFTQRVINYVGYRFNLIWTGKTCFAPKPWVSMRRECWECEGNGAIHSRGLDPLLVNSELCHPCKTQGWIGGRTDVGRAL